MKATLRSIFLTSEQPAATAKFYRDVAGLELELVDSGEYVYWKVERDGMQLAIHDAKRFAEYTDPPFAESNLTHLYFKIGDQQEFLEHLQNCNLAAYSVDDVVVTVVDPDGRRVLFGTA